MFIEEEMFKVTNGEADSYINLPQYFRVMGANLYSPNGLRRGTRLGEYNIKKTSIWIVFWDALTN